MTVIWSGATDNTAALQTSYSNVGELECVVTYHLVPTSSTEPTIKYERSTNVRDSNLFGTNR